MNTTPRWRKSSRSDEQEGSTCVEVADLTSAVIGVRDSKDPQGAQLALGRAGFGELVTRIKSGGLDL